MAITLNIEITDAQQAKIVEAAAIVAPDAKPAAIKAWAERTCKQALRAEVRSVLDAARREAENEARQAVDADWSAAWADDTGDTGDTGDEA